MSSQEQDQSPGLSAPISFGMRPRCVCSWGSAFTTGLFCSGTELCHCPTAEPIRLERAVPCLNSRSWSWSKAGLLWVVALASKP